MEGAPMDKNAPSAPSAPSSEPLIRIKNLSASFGTKQVLKDISLTVEPRSITALIGPSGCGKTTLLKHILGLYAPPPESVYVNGMDLGRAGEEDFRQLRRRIGMLFQHNALLNSVSILENAAIPMEQHTALPPEIIRLSIQRKLDLLGIGDTIDKRPSQLSGGMQKRAALARAIALDPLLLFCDEPTSGLDPITSRKLDALIASLRDKLSTTIVFVSHDVSSIGRLADKIVFLYEGNAVYPGPYPGVFTCGHPAVNDFCRAARRPGP